MEAAYVAAHAWPWKPDMDDAVRTKQLKGWEKAISKTLGWVEEGAP